MAMQVTPWQQITADQVRNEKPVYATVECYDGTPGSGHGKWQAVFTYKDSSQQKFDGKQWQQRKLQPEFNLFGA